MLAVNQQGGFLRLLTMAQLPLVVLAMQVFDLWFSVALLVTLLLLALFFKWFRESTLLSLFTLVGYQLWRVLSLHLGGFFSATGMTAEWTAALSRFALLGYLVLFALWQTVSPARANYFARGDLGGEIRFPFVWWGTKDSVLRFGGIFSLLCLLAVGLLLLRHPLPSALLGAGICFALLNSMLEELLWRGFVLQRTSDLFGERAGLLVMSLAFGLYHHSLGFSLPACLVLSLGGVYFGGAALCSKGLAVPMVMHLSMNLLFLPLGILF